MKPLFDGSTEYKTVTIGLIVRIYRHPYGALKITAQLLKYSRVLHLKPSNKVYMFLLRMTLC